MFKTSIKIVFIGDSKVGKTSMIKNSIDAENYEERNLASNESLINPILIQNDNSGSNMNIILIDTSSSQDRLQQTITEIKNADGTHRRTCRAVDFSGQCRRCRLVRSAKQQCRRRRLDTKPDTGSDVFSRTDRCADARSRQRFKHEHERINQRQYVVN